MKLLNNRGISAVEMLVSTVMLAALGTLTAVIVTNVQTMVGSTERVLKIEEMHSEIMLILSDPQQCTNTFAPHSIPAVGGSVTIPNGDGIRIRDNSVKYSTNSAIGSRNMRIESMTARNFNTGSNVGARAPYTGVFTFEIVYSYEVVPGGAVRTQTRQIRLNTLPANWNPGTRIVDNTNPAGCTAGLGAGLGLDLGPFITRDNTSNVKFNDLRVNGKVEVNGNIVIQDAGSMRYPSDERLKTDFTKLNFTYDQIKQVSGYSFKWKDNGNSDYGFMADEIRSLDSSLVSHEDGKSDLVKYQELVPILHGSIVSLGNEAKDIKKRINKLNQKIK
ncbi:MAG: hypothetical protein B7Y39_12000 [Bdellovibrio sp. 28-41-41]|nr:MAG: hypothetical protein B7Y39_12000 [Bdellovibrio sp. 28-41-41]